VGGSEFFPKIKRQFGLSIILIGSTVFFPSAFSADNDMFFGLSLVFGAVKVFRAIVRHFFHLMCNQSLSDSFQEVKRFF
jgi:hypothetical protein